MSLLIRATILLFACFESTIVCGADVTVGELPAVRLSVIGEPEAVFRWSEQRCDRLHIPDSAARAFRRSDGQIALLAAHFTNVLLLGEDFDRLTPACETTSRGQESDDPASFDDRFW